MNLYTTVKRAGVIGKSLGYVTWGVKQVFKIGKKASNTAMDALNSRRQYKVCLQICNSDTGEYHTQQTEKALTSKEALDLMDSVEHFSHIIAEVRKVTK